MQNPNAVSNVITQPTENTHIELSQWDKVISNLSKKEKYSDYDCVKNYVTFFTEEDIKNIDSKAKMKLKVLSRVLEALGGCIRVDFPVSLDGIYYLKVIYSSFERDYKTIQLLWYCLENDIHKVRIDKVRENIPLGEWVECTKNNKGDWVELNSNTRGENSQILNESEFSSQPSKKTDQFS